MIGSQLVHRLLLPNAVPWRHFASYRCRCRYTRNLFYALAIEYYHKAICQLQAIQDRVTREGNPGRCDWSRWQRICHRRRYHRLADFAIVLSACARGQGGWRC